MKRRFKLGGKFYYEVPDFDDGCTGCVLRINTGDDCLDYKAGKVACSDNNSIVIPADKKVYGEHIATLAKLKLGLITEEEL